MIRFRILLTTVVATGQIAMAPAAQAGWKMIPAQSRQNVGELLLRPSADWNGSSSKPGPRAAAWTKDGLALNSLEIFSGVAAGQPLYRERNSKRNPMPKFDPTMLLPELADYFERSFRANNPVADFGIDEITPAELAGIKAIGVRYHYLLVGDDLTRRGEARLASKAGALYAINFQAPALHFFDAEIGEARGIMDGATFAKK
jgi:hypothetical protein